MSLAEDIRAYAMQARSPIVKVPSPELPAWDGQLAVKRVCPRAIANHWKESDDDNPNDERAKFFVMVACDLEGNRIFQAGDVLWLSTSEALTSLIERAYYAGLHINGLTAENRQSWRKNLPPEGGDGSPSSSSGPSQPSGSASQET